jgi:hypothetical protein
MSKFNPYLRHNIASKTCLASNKTVNRLKSNWKSILIW